MSQRPRIIIAQQQRLALNTGLSAAIRMLRSDAAGLTRYLEEQAAENPHIRLVGPEPAAIGDWLPRWSGVLSYGAMGDAGLVDPAAAGPSLTTHALESIRGMTLSPPEARIALALVEALEPSGWLGRSVQTIAAELGTPEVDVLAVLSRLQQMEPTGIFARNLAECLRLQAAELGELDAVMEILLQNLNLLAAGDVQRLTRLCGCDAEGIARRFRTIRRLNPKPGASFAPANPAHLREPDILARPLKDGRWQVSLNRSALPEVEVVMPNADESRDPDAKQARTAAKALQHMVKARNSTLLRVGREIVTRQQAALVQGPAALKPMRMADLAEALGLHVSTISRVVAGASLDAPFGVIWLRQMFSAGRGGGGGGGGGVQGGEATGETSFAAGPQAVAALRHRLARIIAAENRSAPLSDAALARRLAEETGVVLARRTIAQYREAAGIPPAHRRRLRPIDKGRKPGSDALAEKAANARQLPR